MFRVITTDRSLMFVQNQHIDRFYEVAEKMEKYYYIIMNENVTQVDDAWILAFNTWVMLQPDSFQLIPSVEKLLYYSPNFLVLEALENDKNFQLLKNRAIGNEELTFLSALTITYGLWLWILYIMDEYDLNHIEEKNKKLIYHDSHKGSKQELKAFMNNQTRLTKAIVKEMNSTKTFQDMVKKSCNEAYTLYDEDFESK